MLNGCNLTVFIRPAREEGEACRCFVFYTNTGLADVLDTRNGRKQSPVLEAYKLATGMRFSQPKVMPPRNESASASHDVKRQRSRDGVVVDDLIVRVCLSRLSSPVLESVTLYSSGAAVHQQTFCNKSVSCSR